MVRLGRGSAMQLRFKPKDANITFRIVPIAKATQVNGDAPWHTASEAQIQGWMRPDSAIGQWLFAKGFTGTEPNLDVAMEDSSLESQEPAYLFRAGKNFFSTDATTT